MVTTRIVESGISRGPCSWLAARHPLFIHDYSWLVWALVTYPWYSVILIIIDLYRQLSLNHRFTIFYLHTSPISPPTRPPCGVLGATHGQATNPMSIWRRSWRPSTETCWPPGPVAWEWSRMLSYSSYGASQPRGVGRSGYGSGSG